MEVDYLLIGQGISGTWLSYFLLQAGKKVLVMDADKPHTASISASGVINPVTGRQVVNTWMIEQLLPYAEEAYGKMGQELGDVYCEQKEIISFPPSFQMKASYEKRTSENNPYVFTDEANTSLYREHFNFFIDPVRISPCYLVLLQPLLAGYRRRLSSLDSFIAGDFNETQLEINGDKILYGDITAHKIIYCNGVATASSRYWSRLPFIANKGQALIISVPGLPVNNIYKFGNLTLVPWYDGLWWVGSSYENDYTTTEPTETFREQAIQGLQQVLKMPFSVQQHIASLRPAVLAERRPFVGLHPLYPQVAIFNGMGSKGCSLAPWFANELAGCLTGSGTINPLADVRRFSRILTR